MKIIKFFLILLLLGALVQTSSLVNARDDLGLLQTEDEEDDETHTEDEDETDDDDHTNHEDDDDEDSEDEKEEKDNAYERQIELEQEDDKFQLQSELKVGENKDKIEVEFKVEDKAEIKLKYKSESDALEAKFKYRVSFEKVVEYWDVDGTGFSNTSVALSELKFKEWDVIKYEILNVDGADVYVVTATTSDQVFSLVLRFAASILALDGALLTPNSVKIDVIINNYEYLWDNSSLAVSVKIKTESKLEKEDQSTEEEAGFALGESQVAIGALSEGFFSWAETATADGVVVDVLTSTLQESSHEDDDLEENETSQKLYFSFITTNASAIVWDPKVGVVSEGTQELIAAIESKFGPAAGDGSSLPGFGFWMILVSLGVIQVFILKRKNN
ncbi:MAG: hypothetical protein HeimC2_11320 [Candidatus Heimdallarchaeota archaeon LC_2]|nr:MAG: hypothetical protein HeimC2_11320 [Candidatus Heimdallarchaeota archaeon LC_2]